MKSTITILSLTLISLCFLNGCGSGGADLEAVYGTVTNSSGPIANATVLFVPQGSGRPAAGTTDDNGKFTLEFTSSQSGAVAGKYNVTITGPGKETERGGVEGPKLYSEDGVEVKDGSNKFDFNVE